MDRGEYIPNSLFIKPIINLFSHEYEGGAYRKCLTEKSLDHANYRGKIGKVILETLEYYRGINSESVESRNWVKILRPQSYYEHLSLIKQQKELELLKNNG